MSDDCIFCQIIEGKVPSYMVHEDERTLAFMDLFPVRPGHVLVIPKEHHSDIFGASTESLQAVIATVKRVADALGELYDPPGLMVAQLNGQAAGQTVFHYHTHLIPREEGDSVTLHSRTEGDPEELARIAAELRTAIEA